MKQLLGGLAIAALLSACGATTENAQKTSVSTAETPAVSVAKPEVSSKKAEVTGKVAALPEKPTELDEKAEAEPDVEIPAVSVLKGKSVQDILQLFGPPTLRRKDSPAEVWQYLTSSCALHLVFYPDLDDKNLKVSYYAMNDREAPEETAEERCFRSQLRRVGFDKLKTLS
ncbi:hypothetical protein [Sneathiella limimaris]|uniref:hypothetical protein n=1 Tax=Sneathiella limimaris TaxID=1964213 RepID=UPI00146BB9B7|nr:hypothetical protein [Sneathiella limimaris]